MKKTLTIFALLSSTLVFAQLPEADSLTQPSELSISEVSIVGDKAKSMPGSGQYIGNLKLQKLNQTSINNVLRMMPGVTVRDEEGFGLRPNIGLRGTQVNRSAKITIMEDGILMAPAPYSDPSAYYFPTFARMRGVEVLKGSSQIKHGPYSIGGAVNLISTAIPESFQGFAQLSYGSFGTNQQRVWIGDSHENIDYVFEVNRLASNGFKELDNGGNTGFDRRDVMGKLRWHTAEGSIIPQSVTFKFVNTTEEGDETYLGLTYEDFKINPMRRYAATQADKLDMKHYHISLTHSILPIKGLSINTTAYYTNTFRDWARVNSAGGQNLNNILANPTTYQTPYLIMTGQADGAIDFRSAARGYFSKGVQTNAQYVFKTKAITHTLQVGIRYHMDEADRYATSSTYTMTGGKMILTTAGVNGNQENQIRSANSLAAYLSYDFRYKGLKVSPGIRYEKIHFDFKNYGNADFGRLGASLKSAENNLSVFMPGIGANYEFNQYMSAFAGMHKGFSPPGMPSVTSTTGQARPETALSYELGYRYGRNGFNTQVVGFWNEYENILGSDNMSSGGTGTGDLFNAGDAQIKGAELSLEYDVLYKQGNLSEWRLPINVVYTYTDATFRDTFQNAGGDWGTGLINAGDFIPFITPHTFTVSAGIEYRKFNATLIGRYIGDTRTKPGKGGVVKPGDNVAYNDVNTIAGYFVLDLSANYKFTRHVSAFTAINNITNNTGIVANLPQGYRPNMPFSIVLGLKADW